MRSRRWVTATRARSRSVNQDERANPMSPTARKTSRAVKSNMVCLSVQERQIGGIEMVARRLQLLGEVRPDTGRPELADDLALLVHAFAVEEEEVLGRDRVALH